MSLDIKSLMAKAKEMQDKVQEMQKKTDQIVVVGESGGGMIKVHINGARKVLRTEIDSSLLEDKDADMLSDLITAAFNDASQRIEKEVKQTMSGLAKDMQLDLPHTDDL